MREALRRGPPGLGQAVRQAAAVSAAKLAATVSRLSGRGGGTALPGLVASTLDASIVSSLAGQLGKGVVVVTGTNGKTTTSRMIATVLQDGHIALLRNASGSNLSRGLATSLVARADPLGRIRDRRDLLGLFEVDEAALAEVLHEVTPRTVLLLDLFRDQLDRYGEVATVARIWRGALQRLDARTVLVSNADDPLVTDVAEGRPTRPLTFGIDGAERSAEIAEHAVDAKACPRCGGAIEYSVVFLGHLGHYRCMRCGFARLEPEVRALNVRLRGVHGSEFDLVTPRGSAPVSLRIPGMYNVYNALGAAATCISLGLNAEAIARSLARATPAFGRMECIEIDGREVYLALAKNPAGLNEVIRTLTEDERPIHLLAMLSDNIADGRDVSWIWDADVEMLRGRVANATFAGTRAEDLALRYKYAGVIADGATVPWGVEKTSRTAFERALEATPPGRPLFIVPTYTAMLDVRGVLSGLGYARPYWEDEG